MKYVIVAVGFENGVLCPHAGQFLKSFDHEAHNGQGDGVFTKKLERAKRFDSHEEIFEFWKRQATCRPLRPDGQPNRPLTALTITMEPVEE